MGISVSFKNKGLSAVIPESAEIPVLRPAVEIHLTLNFVQLTLNFLDPMKISFLQFSGIDGQRRDAIAGTKNPPSDVNAMLFQKNKFGDDGKDNVQELRQGSDK